MQRLVAIHALGCVETTFVDVDLIPEHACFSMVSHGFCEVLICCSLFFSFCLLFDARCPLIVARCSSLVARWSLFICEVHIKTPFRSGELALRVMPAVTRLTVYRWLLIPFRWRVLPVREGLVPRRTIICLGFYF